MAGETNDKASLPPLAVDPDPVLATLEHSAERLTPTDPDPLVSFIVPASL